MHVSFVRSVTMDAFKNPEIQRMEKGGNEPWKTFFDSHPITLSEGRTFEDSTIKERYDSEVGEEWKEKLSAEIEGREYVPGQVVNRKKKAVAAGLNDNTNDDDDHDDDEVPTQKERNEAYFAKLGSVNASRRDDLPPSQGGKFAGFGGGLPPPSSSRVAAGDGASIVPGFDDFQKDPVATLSKGFGWFTSTVGRSAKTVNDSYIQPTAKSVRFHPQLIYSICFIFSLILYIYIIYIILTNSILNKYIASRIRFRIPSQKPSNLLRTKLTSRSP